MIDKNLLRLLGKNKMYIFYTVALMVVGLFANLTITASLCYAIHLALHYAEQSGGPVIFLPPCRWRCRRHSATLYLDPFGR